MEDLIKQWTVLLASGVQVSAAVIIGFAALQATMNALRLFWPSRKHAVESQKESIRLSLGRWLALALEFELAADILRTAITPTWNDIGQLAAIVVLRTMLNYFLAREIRHADQAQNQAVQ